jgi:hypothetical protein
MCHINHTIQQQEQHEFDHGTSVPQANKMKTLIHNTKIKNGLPTNILMKNLEDYKVLQRNTTKNSIQNMK